MKVQQLPTLPQVPNNGKGRLEVAIDFTGPQTVETRLGRIPRDYETSSGRERVEDIYFPANQAKEASNPYGRSREIWKPIPLLESDGSPKMGPQTADLVAQPKSKIGTTLKWGLPAAALGGFAGFMAGILAGAPGTGAAIGASLLGGAGALLGYSDAATDRVKLEWQQTPIQDFNLVGYRLEVDEDEDCDSDGKNCSSDYEHEFRPLLETKELGTYFKPVVVHYKES